MSVSSKTLFLTRFAILLALEAVVCFTPLGSIPIGPIVATLGMVPVIITAIVLGPKAGTLMGFIAGLFSFLVMTFTPMGGVTAFVFTPFYSIGEVHGNLWSLVICFVPRILTGTVAGALFNALEQRFTGRKVAFAYGLAGLAGSMTNTLGVMAGIYFFFGRDYAAVAGMAYEALLGLIGMVILTNGVAEAVVATVLASVICQPLRRMTARLS